MDKDVTQPVERSRPTCPECGKGDPLRIAYGYPGFDMFEAEQRGELLLGGCVIEPDSPTWACRACRHTWGGPPSRTVPIAGHGVAALDSAPAERE